MAKTNETTTDTDLRRQLTGLQQTVSAMLERLTDTETRAPRAALTPRRVAGMATTEISPALQRLIAEAHEPKRQRKPRHMPSRVSYRCKPASNATMIRALQELTPAAKTIFFYLAAHPGATVPEIAAGVDLKDKTVANLLSVMKGAHLILSEKR